MSSIPHSLDDCNMCYNGSMNDTLTIEEACKVLGISRASMYKRIAEGRIAPLPRAPGARRRYRTLFARAEVERFIREQGENQEAQP